MAKSKTSRTYQYVADRDKGCQYCGDTPLEIHHIIFRSQGGPDEAWNLIGLCKLHHQAAHMRPKDHPRWLLHGAVMHGLTVTSYLRLLFTSFMVPAFVPFPGTADYKSCISCEHRSEVNDCAVWDHKVDWDYVCDAWKVRRLDAE